MPDDDEVARWEAEPVKVLLFPTSAFLSNKKGFPVLSKRHQAVSTGRWAPGTHR